VRDGGNDNAQDNDKAVNEYLRIPKVLVHRFLLCTDLEETAGDRTLVQAE
jgi:hypothetical protein